MKKIQLSFMSIILVSGLIFQISVIPETLNLKVLGRVINILVLFVLLILFIYAIHLKKYTQVTIFYVIPVSLVLFGYFLNLLRSMDINSLRYTYILLPWLAAIAIPFDASLNTEKAWNIFYIFILITTTISLIEYCAIFYGLLVPSIIETDRGSFLKGVISLLHKIKDDEPYYRFYGVFGEPGTAAMFLSVALTYALVFSKKLAALVFIIALYLTDSLGGYLGFFITMTLFILWKVNELHYSLLKKMVIICSIVLIGFIFSNYFYTRFLIKQETASMTENIREDNIVNFINNFSNVLTNYPLGYELNNLESNKDYYGSNLMCYVAFVQGGLLAFVGYCWFFLIISILSVRYYFLRHNPNKIIACAFISLPPMLTFAFQRTTIIECILFAFLFAVPLIEMIRGMSPTRGITIPQEKVAEILDYSA